MLSQRLKTSNPLGTASTEAGISQVNTAAAITGERGKASMNGYSHSSRASEGEHSESIDDNTRRRSLRAKNEGIVYDQKYHPTFDQAFRPNHPRTLKHCRDYKGEKEKDMKEVVVKLPRVSERRNRRHSAAFNHPEDESRRSLLLPNPKQPARRVMSDSEGDDLTIYLQPRPARRQELMQKETPSSMESYKPPGSSMFKRSRIPRKAASSTQHRRRVSSNVSIGASEVAIRTTDATEMEDPASSQLCCELKSSLEPEVDVSLPFQSSAARRSSDHHPNVAFDNPDADLSSDDGIQAIFDQVIRGELRAAAVAEAEGSTPQERYHAYQPEEHAANHLRRDRVPNSTTSCSTDEPGSPLTQQHTWSIEDLITSASCAQQIAELPPNGFLDGAGSPKSAMDLVAGTISARPSSVSGELGSKITTNIPAAPGLPLTPCYGSGSASQFLSSSLRATGSGIPRSVPTPFAGKSTKAGASSTPPRRASPNWFLSPYSTPRQKGWARAHRHEEFDIWEDPRTSTTGRGTRVFSEDKYAKENIRNGRTLRPQLTTASTLQGDDELRDGARARAEQRNDDPHEEEDVEERTTVLAEL
jgi:hypothetical protein